MTLHIYSQKNEEIILNENMITRKTQALNENQTKRNEKRRRNNKKKIIEQCSRKGKMQNEI